MTETCDISLNKTPIHKQRRLRKMQSPKTRSRPILSVVDSSGDRAPNPSTVWAQSLSVKNKMERGGQACCFPKVQSSPFPPHPHSSSLFPCLPGCQWHWPWPSCPCMVPVIPTPKAIIDAMAQVPSRETQVLSGPQLGFVCHTQHFFFFFYSPTCGIWKFPH